MGATSGSRALPRFSTSQPARLDPGAVVAPGAASSRSRPSCCPHASWPCTPGSWTSGCSWTTSPPRRGGSGPGGSFQPITAILLPSCKLALHARQLDVRLQLDYVSASQCGTPAPHLGSWHECPGSPDPAVSGSAMTVTGSRPGPEVSEPCLARTTPASAPLDRLLPDQTGTLVISVTREARDTP
ncbi:uncharacterized protein [Vicugna pacos]|uniref:Uncharacterized protein isoform X2 n=1 Tax=Vicugna pacos TaxID=30538 RepID=A0ABM5CGC6_VICPA